MSKINEFIEEIKYIFSKQYKEDVDYEEKKQMMKPYVKLGKDSIITRVNPQVDIKQSEYIIKKEDFDNINRRLDKKWKE